MKKWGSQRRRRAIRWKKVVSDRIAEAQRNKSGDHSISLRPEDMTEIWGIDLGYEEETE